MSTLGEQIRTYWDADAATYDDSVGHHPRSALELATWSGVLRRLLPPPPARVLDVGAGTGFVSLLLARQGYRVTAFDLSPGMLSRLRIKAQAAGLELETAEGDAGHPPQGDFAAVVERHLLWTLPDPASALEAWRHSCPEGRLVLLESLWGTAGGPEEQLRASCRETLRRLRAQGSDHHAEYSPEMRAQLPLSGGASSERLVSIVESSGWGPPRVERLRDVEWAARQAMPSIMDRLLGVPPLIAVVAG